MSGSEGSLGHSAGGGDVAPETKKKGKAKVSRTSLILCHARHNDAAAVRKLLEEDLSLVHARDYDNQTLRFCCGGILRNGEPIQEGEWVFLRLQPYRQRSISHRINHKLAPRFYGRYQVVQKIGAVAYKLDLPQNAGVHPIFHVALLKKKLGSKVLPTMELPALGPDDQFLIEPVVAILDRRMIKRRNAPVTQVLIRWSNTPSSDATWEDWSVYSKQNFHTLIHGIKDHLAGGECCGGIPILEFVALLSSCISSSLSRR